MAQYNLLLKLLNIGGSQVNPATAENQALIAKESTLSGKFAPVLTVSTTKTVSGDHIIIAAPGAGNRLRVVWFNAQAKGSVAEGLITVLFRRNGTVIYTQELTGSQPFAHGAVVDFAEGEALVVNMSADGSVIFNFDYRVIPT